MTGEEAAATTSFFSEEGLERRPRINESRASKTIRSRMLEDNERMGLARRKVEDLRQLGEELLEGVFFFLFFLFRIRKE